MACAWLLVQIAEDNSSATVQLGNTKVVAVVKTDLEVPRRDGYAAALQALTV